MVIHRNIEESRKHVGQNYWDRVAGSCWVRGELWFWEGHKDRISESELLATSDGRAVAKAGDGIFLMEGKTSRNQHVSCTLHRGHKTGIYIFFLNQTEIY